MLHWGAATGWCYVFVKSLCSPVHPYLQRDWEVKLALSLFTCPLIWVNFTLSHTLLVFLSERCWLQNQLMSLDMWVQQMHSSWILKPQLSPSCLKFMSVRDTRHTPVKLSINKLEHVILKSTEGLEHRCSCQLQDKYFYMDPKSKNSVMDWPGYVLLGQLG